LDGTYIRLKIKVEAISAELLGFKPDNKWSIKENIGDLFDLDPI